MNDQSQDPSHPRVTIDPDLVERYIVEFASHGGLGDSGVCRPVYTEAWVGAANQYAVWCEEAGLESRRDAVGNVWGVLAGSELGGSIVSGSHIDSQVDGGRYDGALGALAGLIAIRALREQFGTPRRTLEAVALCEEEGSRFPSAGWWGSRAITGRIAECDWDTVLGFEGETIGDAMREVGLDPVRCGMAKRTDIGGFIELHIEQGPILEQADLPIAVVESITGIRHSVVELHGKQNHAGAFPMDLRRDPMAGFAEIASRLINTAHRLGRPTVTTVGRVLVEPNSTPVIPAKVMFTVDARHPDPASCARLQATHEALINEVATRRGLAVSMRTLIDQAPCFCNADLVGMLRAAAEWHGVQHMTMISGAAHDSQQMATIAPMAMIFVRSKDGRSHTPDEFSSIEDIVAGIKVLAGALHALAY